MAAVALPVPVGQCRRGRPPPWTAWNRTERVSGRSPQEEANATQSQGYCWGWNWLSSAGDHGEGLSPRQQTREAAGLSPAMEVTVDKAEQLAWDRKGVFWFGMKGTAWNIGRRLPQRRRPQHRTLPSSAGRLPILGAGVQGDQVSILTSRKLRLSSAGSFRPRGEGKRRAGRAEEGSQAGQDQDRVMSLRSPPLTPRTPLILTLAKQAVKHERPRFPQAPSPLQGGGDCHKGSIQPWQGCLD